MKFLVLLTLFIQTALACEMTFPSNLVILGDTGSTWQSLESKNCSDQTLTDALETISTVDGRISSSQFAEILTQKGHLEVKVMPAMMQIQQLKNIIREQLPLPAGVQVKETRVLNASNYLALNSGDKIEIFCGACLYGSAQPLNLIVTGFDGTKKIFTVNVDFKKMVKAYRLMTTLPAFSEIKSTDMLKEEYIEAIPHTDLVTDLQTLRFFKTNKPLKAGEFLRASDMNALNLVKAGLKTDVILENQVVRIKTQGISRSNGALGEFVEVFHPQKNKKYQGKVIDINKVFVEL